MKPNLLLITCLTLLVACGQETPPEVTKPTDPVVVIDPEPMPTSTTALLTVWRPSSGQWLAFKADSDPTNQDKAGLGAITPYVWGQKGDVPVLGDYDGDGQSDSAVFQPDTGNWKLRAVASSAPLEQPITWSVPLGQRAARSMPVNGDFDGDGRNDAVVFDVKTAHWSGLYSSGAKIDTVLGSPNDVPVSGDFDGDGRSDFATWNPETGVWKSLLSSAAPQLSVSWGSRGDVPMSGDFDGDGRSDFVVYRPATGQWLIRLSSGAESTQVLGGSGDVPVIGDFNDDGKTDYAVWNTVTGVWQVKASGTGGTLSKAFGEGGDVPVQRPFTGRRPLALSVSGAERGVSVQGRLEVAVAAGATVTVGGFPAMVTASAGKTLTFVVPTDAGLRNGLQKVVVTSGGRVIKSQLNVTSTPVILPDAPPLPAGFQPDALFVTLTPNLTAADLAAAQELIAAAGFTVTPITSPNSGNATDGSPCNRVIYSLVDNQTPPRSQSEVNAALEKLKALIYQINPVTRHAIGALPAILPAAPALIVEHRGAIGLETLRARDPLLTGAGVTIAVLDTGISQQGADEARGASYTGDDIQNNTTDHLDAQFTGGAGIGHGTGVASLAAGGALRDGSQAGVAPGAKLISVRVCDRLGRCRASDVLQGLCHTLNVVDPKKLVINMSLGGGNASPIINEVLRYAISRGALVVTSGGNDGQDGSPTHFPAAANGGAQNDGWVAVAALELDPSSGQWRHAGFSTRGSYIDIAAPGSGIGAAIVGGGYVAREGTSFAAPLVAGALALWRQAYPDATPAELEALLKANASPLSTGTPETVGAGMINLNNQPSLTLPIAPDKYQKVTLNFSELVGQIQIYKLDAKGERSAIAYLDSNGAFDLTPYLDAGGENTFVVGNVEDPGGIFSRPRRYLRTVVTADGQTIGGVAYGCGSCGSGDVYTFTINKKLGTIR